jgi:hypothetical protein
MTWSGRISNFNRLDLNCANTSFRINVFDKMINLIYTELYGNWNR